MNTFDTIKQALLDDIRKYIRQGETYNTEPRVVYGIYENNSPEYPIIYFCEDPGESIVLDGNMNNTGIAYINIKVWGFVKITKSNEISGLGELTMDFIRFITTDFTYKSRTRIGNISILPPSEGQTTAGFGMDVQVSFDYTESTINT